MKKGEIKYLLQNKKYIEAEIKDLGYQIEELQSLDSVSISGVSFEERIKASGISNTTEKQALANVLKIEKLQKERIGLGTQIKRLEQGMEVLEELELKVLTMKYIENNKWSYINRKLKNENGNCRYAADKAIEKLSRVMK